MPARSLPHWLAAVFVLTAPFSAVRADAPRAAAAPSSSSTVPAARRSMTVIEGTQRRTGTTPYVAVVGAVARPGSFEIAGSCTIDDLLQRAGGLTDDSASALRIVRRSVPLDLQLAANRGNPVFPGDVVVIRASDQNPGSEHPSIACIGLLDRPVVIPLRQERPTVERLMEQLHQSAELVAIVRTRFITGGKAVGSSPLQPGDVIAIDSSRVNRAALEGSTLIEAAIPLNAPEAIPASDVVEMEPPAIAPLQELPSTPDFAGQPSLPLPGDSTSGDPFHAVDESVELIAPAPVVVQDLAPEPPAEHEAALAIPAVPAIEVPPPAASPVLKKPSVADGIPTGRVALSVERPPQGPGVFSAVMLFVGLAGLGVAIAWVTPQRQQLLSRIRNRLLKSARSSQGAAVEALSDPFMELVNDRIPIDEEPVIFPDRLELHGTAVGQTRLIIHPAQPLAGPHFAQSAAAARETAHVHEAHLREPKFAESVSRSRPESPSRAAAANDGGLLERVLLAMQREGRR